LTIPVDMLTSEGSEQLQGSARIKKLAVGTIVVLNTVSKAY